MQSLRCPLILASLLFSLCLLGQGDDFLSESVLKWERATAYTLEVARAMPASEYGFRPCPEEMTFGQQLDHMAENMAWLAGWLTRWLAKPWPDFGQRLTTDAVLREKLATPNPIDQMTRFDPNAATRICGSGSN